MKGILDRKIPTILGIVLILIAIPLTTFSFKNQTNLSSHALGLESPQNIKITNISDQSFTLTYETSQPSTGSIKYGLDKKLGRSTLEELDEDTGIFSPGLIHSISVKALTPSTKYYFVIVSGSDTFLNNGNPYEVTTGPEILSSNQGKIINGKIILPDGTVPSEALTYLHTQGSQTLSSIISKGGEFSFLLTALRTNNLDSSVNLSNESVFEIFVTNGTLNSNITASFGQNGSVPTITLSNNYDFTQETSPVASKSAKLYGFPSTASKVKNLKSIISNPKNK